MGIVSYEFYTETYAGEAVDAAAFPKYDARAEDIINMITRGALKGYEQMPAEIQEAVQKSICAQIEFFAVNGIEVTIDGNVGGGFTVGKVTLQSSAHAKTEAQSMIAPMAFMYLETTGLLRRDVATFDAPWLYWH